MQKIQFQLIQKISLTHDVFELVYSCPNMLKEPPKAGQYVMFQLAPWLNRAYSLASFTETTFTLIIKRISDGRGSPIICDAKTGSIFEWLFPLGHFTLQETHKSKCFIGTWTGFAPLYCQMLDVKKILNFEEQSLAFIFWVRSFSDSFYEAEIKKFGANFTHFEYVPYFSRETDFTASSSQWKNGYVTDWITQENIVSYEEFYLCGSPAMVKSAREKLTSLGITKERVFWEQF